MQFLRMRWLPCLMVAMLAAGAIACSAPNNNAGASGSSSAASASASAPKPQVRVFSAADMAAAFAEGKTLVNGQGLDYKVMTGQRQTPGEVEVHVHYTDVIYITEGAATFVTGGRVVDPKTVSPGQIRGKSIEGGVAHHLEKGSLVVIPAGTPHWFKSVTKPVMDLVVKVRTK